ncbi:MAG: VTT domain-containing protein [Rhodobacteraceae bacterium]|nr:VTT domain-containing protein [Paracoccaceae bacterium]
MDGATVSAVINDYGILILAPLALIEGPIATLVAAYMASRGLLSLSAVLIIVILADVIGDSLLYAIGRNALTRLSPALRARFGITPRRVDQCGALFERRGVWVLVFGKLTHVSGFPILIAAGASRMPFAVFVLTNLLATIPKSLTLVALGYFLGNQMDRIADWLSYGSALALILLGVAGLGVYLKRTRRLV